MILLTRSKLILNILEQRIHCADYGLRRTSSSCILLLHRSMCICCAAVEFHSLSFDVSQLDFSGIIVVHMQDGLSLLVGGVEVSAVYMWQHMGQHSK